MSKPITDEHLRILNAVEEQRFRLKKSGRYEIDREMPPDRKSREQLVKRGLLTTTSQPIHSWTHWRVTAKGKAAINDWVAAKRLARETE